jgi:NAD(P)-dependent dehydrogenase (short-subunit alcohol dehydrogenase family)
MKELDMKLLDGKAAIVTGAGRGIGRGHCLHLAQAGAAVVINDVDTEAAQNVADEITAAGGRAIICGVSIATRVGAEELIERCVAAFGAVDILINNAGNLRDRSFLKMSDDEFDAVWLVHVKGTFWCSQAAALQMRARGAGGVIINTTSGAHFGSFGQTNYAAAKGAIASMTYTWALELARYGIRINAIGPTGSTRMSGTFKSADGSAAELDYIDPALNGPLVVFLCSEQAQGVSGQIFGSGGERIAHMVQPHYGKTLLREGGWSVTSIARHFETLRGEFGALGMLGQPYPFHEGVFSADEKAANSAAPNANQGT